MREIVFAEDLLTLDSHEFLVAAFGKGNVKEDWFYFTAENRKKCSVIFPNTSRQAIFIWEDEDNRREISFILIGEQMGNEKGNQTAVMLSDHHLNHHLKSLSPFSLKKRFQHAKSVTHEKAWMDCFWLHLFSTGFRANGEPERYYRFAGADPRQAGEPSAEERLPEVRVF